MSHVQTWKFGSITAPLVSQPDCQDVFYLNLTLLPKSLKTHIDYNGSFSFQRAIMSLHGEYQEHQRRNASKRPRPTLPNEIYLEIHDYLDYWDFMYLQLVSKWFHGIVSKSLCHYRRWVTPLRLDISVPVVSKWKLVIFAV